MFEEVHAGGNRHNSKMGPGSRCARPGHESVRELRPHVPAEASVASEEPGPSSFIPMTRPPRFDPATVTDALAADRERALALMDVSRETLARLDRFVALLLDA